MLIVLQCSVARLQSFIINYKCTVMKIMVTKTVSANLASYTMCYKHILDNKIKYKPSFYDPTSSMKLTKYLPSFSNPTHTMTYTPSKHNLTYLNYRHQ